METIRGHEMWNELAGKAVETMSVWAEVNRRTLQELVDLSAAAARETVQVYGELQQSALEALQSGQVAADSWQATWQEGAQDPVGLHQKAVTTGVDNAQKAFRFWEGSAAAVSRSADRLQASAERAGKDIQETVTAAVSKVKNVYAAS